jgi:protein TonB
VQQARTALDAGQPARAESLLQAAAGLGNSADAAALSQRIAQLKAADAGPSEVPEASLTRIKGIELQYPLEARSKGLEGWVELAYAVAADGRVSNVKVTNSSPAGVFDQAATRAIARLRYQPPLQSGKPVAVTTGMHLTFRLAN